MSLLAAALLESVLYCTSPANVTLRVELSESVEGDLDVLSEEQR